MGRRALEGLACPGDVLLDSLWRGPLGEDQNAEAGRAVGQGRGRDTAGLSGESVPRRRGVEGPPNRRRPPPRRGAGSGPPRLSAWPRDRSSDRRRRRRASRQCGPRRAPRCPALPHGRRRSPPIRPARRCRGRSRRGGGRFRPLFTWCAASEPASRCKGMSPSRALRSTSVRTWAMGSCHVMSAFHRCLTQLSIGGTLMHDGGGTRPVKMQK